MSTAVIPPHPSPQGVPGTFLLDVISSNFPFNDLCDAPAPPPPSPPAESVQASSQGGVLARHIDMLNLTALNALYHYDSYA